MAINCILSSANGFVWIRGVEGHGSCAPPLFIHATVAFFRSAFVRLYLSHAKQGPGRALRALFEAVD